METLETLQARLDQLLDDYRSAKALTYNAAQLRRGVGRSLQVEEELEHEIDAVRAQIRAAGGTPR